MCDRFAAPTDNRRQLPDCADATAPCRRNAFIGGHVAASQHTVRGCSVRLYSVLAAALVTTLASPLAAQRKAFLKAPPMARMSDTTRRALSGGWSAAPLAASKVCSGSDLATAIGKGNQPIDAAIRPDIPIALCTVAIPAERIPLTPARPACGGHAGLWRSGHRPRSLVRCWLRASQPLIMSFAERSRAAVAWWRLRLRLRRRRSRAGRKESIHQWPALPLTAIFWE